MTQETPSSATPWYKQFWPWLVISFPLLSVVAGISTVVIAFTHRDALVRDDWYRDGMAINRRFDADNRARLLGMRAQLRVDQNTGDVTAMLEGKGSETLALLELDLSHAAFADRDRTLNLRRDETGSFRGQLEQQLRGRWYATLRPPRSGDPLGPDAPSWRLFQRLDLPRDEAFEFGTPLPALEPQAAAGLGS